MRGPNASLHTAASASHIHASLCSFRARFSHKPNTLPALLRTCTRARAPQVKYAALDVLVAGQVFRALRLWHSSPERCEVCHHHLGCVAASGPAGHYACSCGKGFAELRGYLAHCEVSRHAPRWGECDGCGCARPLPWPASGRAAAGGGGGGGVGGAEEQQE